MSPSMTVLRRFAVEWLSAADPTVCDEIMSPDYQVEIGGIVLDGLESYREGTVGQLMQFPGLLITVHAVVNAGDRVALRFTEHGPSVRHDGRAAAWRGIGLFFLRDGRLVRNLTEEDYAGRRRQLTLGVPDPVDAPAAAPWATPIGSPDAEAERTVRHWLATDHCFTAQHVVVDDGLAAAEEPPLEVSSVSVTDLFSSGSDVAFRVHQRGVPAANADWSGDDLTLSSVGIVTVAADGAISGHVVRDTAGLGRAVRAAARVRG
jgi:hypothetical protein